MLVQLSVQTVRSTMFVRRVGIDTTSQITRAINAPQAAKVVLTPHYVPSALPDNMVYLHVAMNAASAAKILFVIKLLASVLMDV